MKSLLSILDTMTVPSLRKDLTPSNLLWLLRNISIQNKDHKDLDKALILIKQALKTMHY